MGPVRRGVLWLARRIESAAFDVCLRLSPRDEADCSAYEVARATCAHHATMELCVDCGSIVGGTVYADTEKRIEQ